MYPKCNLCCQLISRLISLLDISSNGPADIIEDAEETEDKNIEEVQPKKKGRKKKSQV